MSILNEELEERYPIEEGDCITLTREQLALQLRRAYKAGATRDYKSYSARAYGTVGDYRNSPRLPTIA